jgi:acyl-coenzyme A thioesterase PaaI-like protein
MILPDLNPDHLKAVISAINMGPFFKHMSMRVTELGVGYAVVVIEIGREHMNLFGGVMAALASAIDTAAYWSALRDLPKKMGWFPSISRWTFCAGFCRKGRCQRTENQIGFMAPCRGEDVRLKRKGFGPRCPS